MTPRSQHFMRSICTKMRRLGIFWRETVSLMFGTRTIDGLELRLRVRVFAVFYGARGCRLIANGMYVI